MHSPTHRHIILMPRSIASAWAWRRAASTAPTKPSWPPPTSPPERRELPRIPDPSRSDPCPHRPRDGALSALPDDRLEAIEATLFEAGELRAACGKCGHLYRPYLSAAQPVAEPSPRTDGVWRDQSGPDPACTGLTPRGRAPIHAVSDPLGPASSPMSDLSSRGRCESFSACLGALRPKTDTAGQTRTCGVRPHLFAPDPRCALLE